MYSFYSFKFNICVWLKMYVGFNNSYIRLNYLNSHSENWISKRDRIFILFVVVVVCLFFLTNEWSLLNVQLLLFINPCLAAVFLFPCCGLCYLSVNITLVEMWKEEMIWWEKETKRHNRKRVIAEGGIWGKLCKNIWRETSLYSSVSRGVSEGTFAPAYYMLTKKSQRKCVHSLIFLIEGRSEGLHRWRLSGFKGILSLFSDNTNPKKMRSSLLFILICVNPLTGNLEKFNILLKIKYTFFSIALLTGFFYVKLC